MRVPGLSSVLSFGSSRAFIPSLSHNMTTVNQLCSRTIMLLDGQVARTGRTQEVVAEYLKLGSEGGGE